MLIVDTGVLVAAADRDDRAHAACVALLQNEPEQLVTSAMVIAEAAYLYVRQFGANAEAKLYDMILDGQLIVESLTIADWHRIQALVVQYADHPIGGTDASLIALAERHREGRIATLDRRHFGAVKPAHTKAFELVP